MRLITRDISALPCPRGQGRTPPKVRFGVVLRCKPPGIEALRREANDLHPERPLSDVLDASATHLVGTVEERGREKLVAAMRLTRFNPSHSFYQLVTGQRTLPASVPIGERVAELSWLVVAKRFRGRGIGPFLLLQALELLSDWRFETGLSVLQVGMPRGVRCTPELEAQLLAARRMHERMHFEVHDKLPPRRALDSGVPLVPCTFDLSHAGDLLATDKWNALVADSVVFMPGGLVDGRSSTECLRPHVFERRAR